MLLASGIILIAAAACTGATAVPASTSQPAQPAATQTPAVNNPAATGQAEPVKTDQALAATGTSTKTDTSTAVKAVKIAEILSDPKAYRGKTVIVEGKIASECPSGCWFTLKDGNAVIYIDLAPKNLVIPQKKGAFARTTAEVVYVGSDVYLIGSKVEF